MSNPKLRYAMVGGGRGAFIGAVHRRAAGFHGAMELVAGALSSDPDRARLSGQDLGLATGRNHPDWQALLHDELNRPPQQRIQFVSIVTPNHVHFPVAQAFTDAGFNVVCDKPLTHTVEQAQELLRLSRTRETIFAVTYNYTGYPMVRQAREMVRAGILGELRKVVVEYHQGWLATRVEANGANPQAAWRTDPARSGVAGALGDIGSHAENLVATVTGLELEALCADLTTFVPGRKLDDDGSLLLRFRSGARGVMLASQVAVGAENDLRLRVFGSLGSLTWRQEDPNRLLYDPSDGPRQVLTRGGPGLCAAAMKATFLPAGHPEAFMEAFANLYLGIAEAIQARADRRPLGPLEGDFPTLEAGARGVRFIEKTVQSAHSQAKWTPWADGPA
jgi:predicted dehydrogenase